MFIEVSYWKNHLQSYRLGDRAKNTLVSKSGNMENHTILRRMGQKFGAEQRITCQWQYMVHLLSTESNPPSVLENQQGERRPANDGFQPLDEGVTGRASRSRDGASHDVVDTIRPPEIPPPTPPSTAPPSNTPGRIVNFLSARNSQGRHANPRSRAERLP